MSDHRIVTDPATGRPILVAPGRRSRPMHTDPDRDEGPCPFCPGEEHQTPPTRAALPAAAGESQWIARSFCNKYPAATWHEVIAEGREHESQPAALDEPTLAVVAQLWRDRIAAFEHEDDVRVAFLFKNVGRFAGASVEHNHSQLLGLPMLPPRLELEWSQARRDGCPVCADLETAEADGRVIVEGTHHVLLAPRAPKLPFETWLVPRRHDDDFLAPENAADLVTVWRKAFVAIDVAFGSPAFNHWLHRIPGEEFHWHVEFQPRTGFVAGLELGGDMYINAVPPADAAERLRRALEAAS